MPEDAPVMSTTRGCAMSPSLCEDNGKEDTAGDTRAGSPGFAGGLSMGRAPSLAISRVSLEQQPIARNRLGTAHIVGKVLSLCTSLRHTFMLARIRRSRLRRGQTGIAANHHGGATE